MRTRFITFYFFLILFLASCSSSLKLHEGFVTDRDTLQMSDGVYVIKKDGQKITGNRMGFTNLLDKRDKIKMDNATYPVSTLQEWQGDGKHFTMIEKRPALRIVHGNINIYQVVKEVYMGTPGMTNLHPYYFIQKEGQAVSTQIWNSNDIKKAIADCPQATAMMNKPASKLKKEIKRDQAYLNKVFETYNRNCGK